MKRSYIGRFHHLSVFWVLGPSVLALATWACFQLDLSLETVSCVYLVIIVLLSLMDSLVSSVAFSVIAVACLDYFFIGPLFTLEVGRGQDLATLSAFLISFLLLRAS
jgi:K+-sensing histidine kinase KdpD